MKWPETLTLVRHDVSAYNALKPQKAADPLYRQFLRAYEKTPDSDESLRLAVEIKGQFSLGLADHETPLAEGAGENSQRMAANLKSIIQLPDVIFVSPYKRTQQTLDNMILGWPDLSRVKVVPEPRIVEQDHGIALLYNDWRVFNVLHPDQRQLRQMQGAYWYRYPNGENIINVQDRLRLWTDTLIREHSEQGVLAVSHHLTILAFREKHERLGADEFTRLDQYDKPINAGVTIYRGDPNQGEDGHLVLDAYNLKLY